MSKIIKNTKLIIFLLILPSCGQIPLDYGLPHDKVRELDESKGYIEGILLSNQGDKLLYWDSSNNVYEIDVNNNNLHGKHLFKLNPAAFKYYYGHRFINNIDDIPAEWSHFANYLRKVKSCKEKARNESSISEFEYRSSELIPVIMPNKPAEFLKMNQVNPRWIRSNNNALFDYDGSKDLGPMMTNFCSHSMDMRAWIIALSSDNGFDEHKKQDLSFYFFKSRNNKLSCFSISQADMGIPDRYITEISSSLSPSGKWAVLFIQSTLSNSRSTSVSDLFVNIGDFLWNKNISSMAIVDVENESIIWKNTISSLGFQLHNLPDSIAFDEKRNLFYFLNRGKISLYRLEAGSRN